MNSNVIEVYAGYIKERKKLLESASGGTVTAFSEAIIYRGGIVFGAKYSKDFHSVEYCCVEKIEQLEQIKGSKYAPTHKNNVFSRLHEELQNGRLVLFIGLGYDIGAVIQFCQKNRINDKNLYTIDILCHGPVSEEIFDCYISELEKKYKSDLQSLNMRYK